MTLTGGPLLGFLSHSARARAAVGPILESAETLLHEQGWRTRLPRRPDPGSVALTERRRMREEAYAEIERCDAVFHVPAPAALGGTLLNRELQRAVRLGRPIWLLICEDLRQSLDIGLPDPRRLEHLIAETRGTPLLAFSDLRPLLSDWPVPASER